MSPLMDSKSIVRFILTSLDQLEIEEDESSLDQLVFARNLLIRHLKEDNYINFLDLAHYLIQRLQDSNIPTIVEVLMIVKVHIMHLL